jgi:hypothetical protein
MTGNVMTSSMTNVAISALFVTAMAMLPFNAASADVRDVNRTAGDTVDTVMWPQPAPKPKKEEKKVPRCGVVMTILICW